MVPAGFRGGHFTAQHNPLARSEGEVLAGAHRLAVAAFDAPVHFLLDGRRRLEVVHVGQRIIGDQHPRIEQLCRVDQSLDLAHHLIKLVAVLAPDKRGHDPAGAVLGLQRSAGAQDQVHHVLGERLVADQLGSGRRSSR